MSEVVRIWLGKLSQAQLLRHQHQLLRSILSGRCEKRSRRNFR